MAKVKATIRLANGTKRLAKAVGYLRCSTKKQDTSTRDQKAEIQRYAKKHRYEIVRWYVDEGISGDDTEKRLDFQRMRDDASSGDFQFILCWDQDRFGRFDSLEAGFWITPIRKAGVTLVTLNDGLIDWNDFTGRMMYSMKQEGNHDYLVKLSKGVVRGQMEAAKKGSWVGSVPYGYKLQGEKSNKKLILDEVAKVRVVERIFREYVEEGRSTTEIARRLEKDNLPRPGKNPWCFDAVKWILKNIVYVGTFRFNVSSKSKYHSYLNGAIEPGGRIGKKDETDWIVIENHHEPIVSKRTYSKAQAIIAKGRTGQRRYSPDENPYLLSGVLRCGHCGKPMVGTPKIGNKKIRYYECNTRNRKAGCPGTTIRETEMLNALVEYIENEFVPNEAWKRLTRKAEQNELTEKDLPAGFAKLKRMMLGKESAHNNPRRLETQIANLAAEQAKVKRNLEHVDPEFIPHLQTKFRKLEEQRQELLREYKQQPTERDINETVLTVLRKLYWLATLKPDRIKQVLRELDYISVFTTKRGKGTGTRHALKRFEVKMRVGTLQGKLNPHLSA